MRSGRHEEIGSHLAHRVAKRLGLDGATTHAFSLIIELHLAMAQISQRRDLDDPAVIRLLATQVQNVENLDMLTLHSFTDSMGTSNKLWNSFKDTLLWTLHYKTRQMLLGGTDFIRAEEKQRELLADEVKRIMPASFGVDEVQAHFENLPANYFQIHSAREVLSDLALVHRFMHRQLQEEEEALFPVLHWHHETDRGYTTLNVCTWDRAGLFSKITGGLTAAGLNILGAEIITRHDGIIVDTFYVTDAVRGHIARREEKERFETLLNTVMTDGDTDLTALISRQQKIAPVYQSHGTERIPTVIHFDNETSEASTVIDLETEDRMGLLYVISQAFNDLELDVSVARIVTEQGAAVDSFYVIDSDGTKITAPDRQKVVERKLRQAIASGMKKG